MSDEIAVRFTNVTKEYLLFSNNRQRFRALFTDNNSISKKDAVKNVSFVIKKGEAVALMGRNGAGKSSILKLMTAVTNPTRGRIEVNGRVSALLELTAGFDPDFTGRENIYLRCQVMGMSSKEIKQIEEQIVEFADIGIYIDQPVRKYSTGMKARLGFAINSNVSPDILIIDEALSVGDQLFQVKCKNRVKELLTNENITLIFASHSNSSLKAFCDRGIVINNGELVFDDNIDNAIDYYNTNFGNKKIRR